MWTKVVYLFAIVGVALALQESLVVHIEQGPVRGYKDAQGGVFSFLDVPYATAPTGANKFKAPLPPPVWTEPFEAVKRQIACPQTSPGFTIQEDCLVANILIPDTNATNLPVLVSVHGGAYMLGAGSGLEYTSLVRTAKTIVITFNYRLGVPGFLCLGTEDVPGNAGMKDQVALLRWVNKNIASFGGNPDDVTITGCSAGGGSVTLLTLSPITTGLFKRAIIDSGTAIGISATQRDPIENAKIYAKRLNFTNVHDISALEEFYKTASHDLFLSESDFMLDSSEDGLLLFAPCVELKTTKEERFLPETPVKILESGDYSKIPLLHGFTEMEGLFRLPNFENYKDRMNERFSDFLPGELYFESEVQKENVAEKVKKFYFGNQAVSEETILAYVDYFTDVLFAYPILRVANMRRASLGDTIYLYEYSFVDENTAIIPNTNIGGPDHCYQLFAVADEDVTNASEEYKAMKETMRELWLNFITTGNPTPEGSSLSPWPAVDGFVSPFLSLNVTSQVEYSSLLGDKVRFWDSIYEKHYGGPVPPTTDNRRRNPTPEGSSLPPWPAVDGFVSPFMPLNATSRVDQSSLLGDRVRFWDTIYEEF